MPPPSTEEPVTCMACRVHLVGSESRREHYRSEFHRLNLQRKVASLPPLAESDFCKRNEVSRHEEEAVARSRMPRFCAICSKKFSSERALANHIASRRHRDTVRARAPHMSLEDAARGHVVDAPAEGTVLENVSTSSLANSEEELGGMDDVGPDGMTFDEEIDIERRIAEATPFGPNECVFDGLVCESQEANLAHMRSFGFFLPFRESLTDLAGLLEYIGQKVGIGYACVECDRPFTSVSATQQHMVDKQHCRLTSNDEIWFEEYSRFYAFEQSLLPEDHDDGEWEELHGDDAVAAEIAMNEESSAGRELQLEGAPSRDAERTDAYDETEMEEVAMVVGSNKVIGHRSLRRYYRQNIRAPESRDAVLISKAERDLRVLNWETGKVAQDPQLREARMQAFRRSKRLLEVGIKNYYTRKAPLKVPFATFNSGYRP